MPRRFATDGRLDPDHPALTVMDEENALWRDELEAVSPAFREPEREAFHRLAFRRSWMAQGSTFDVQAFFKHRDCLPADVREWCFLLNALVRQCPPSATRVPHLEALAMVANIVSAMTPALLHGIRARDGTLYQNASLTIWAGIRRGCRFEDRFGRHNGAGGMVHAVKGSFIKAFDRYLAVWPVRHDPLLAPVAAEVAPIWDDWLAWMHAHRPEFLPPP